jgi:hypothetical protein
MINLPVNLPSENIYAREWYLRIVDYIFYTIITMLTMSLQPSRQSHLITWSEFWLSISIVAVFESCMRLHIAHAYDAYCIYCIHRHRYIINKNKSSLRIALCFLIIYLRTSRFHCQLNGWGSISSFSGLSHILGT